MENFIRLYWTSLIFGGFSLNFEDERVERL